MRVEGRMKAVSTELVVIISLIIVGLVVVFALRGWISGQISKLGGVDMAAASYSLSYTTPSSIIISLIVRNNMPSPINVTGFNITLSNGTVMHPASPGVSVSPSIGAGYTVSAKSDALFTITLSGISSGTTVRDVNVLVQDPSSGQMQWIKAVGG
ncbi:MAG: hypothetical protein QW369_04705 [Desulfurococcaceae archaeon]